MDHVKNILWGFVGGITWQVADWWVRRRSYNAALRDVEELLLSMDERWQRAHPADEFREQMRKLRR